MKIQVAVLMAVAAGPAAGDVLGQLGKGVPAVVLDARAGANLRAGEDATVTPAGDRLGKAEPHLVRSVANPDVLLGAFTDVISSGSRIGYALSLDGGLAWTRGILPSHQTGSRTYRHTGNCVAAVGPQGDLYVASLGRFNDTGLGLVAVSRSSDGGRTWSGAGVAASASAQSTVDRPWVVVNDFPGTPNPGRLLVTWANLTFDARGATTGINLNAALSDDRGATWSAATPITPSGSTTEASQGCQTLFLPDGSVVALFTTLTAADVTPLPNGEAVINQYRVDCRRSSDGGRTFPATGTTAIGTTRTALTPEVVGGGYLLPTGAVARQTGELWVCCVGQVAGVPRVLVARSADRGATWTSPVAVSANPAGSAILNHGITASPDGRTISVVFLQRHDSSVGRDLVDLYGTTSFDGGTTWQPALRLSEQASDLRRTVKAQPSNLPLYGDNLGFAPALGTDQPCVALWCDTRLGSSELFATRVAPVAAPSFNAWRTTRFSRAELADATRSGPAADFDGDGCANLIEYAQGTNPRAAESGSGFAVMTRPTDIAVGERTLAGRDDLTARWESSGDGAAWAPAAVDPAASVPAPYQGAIAVVPGRTTYFRRRYTLGAAVVPSTEVFVTHSDERLVNLATRGQVRTGASQLIVGFVVAGGGKNVLLRGIGPALAAFGLPGAVADPQLTLQSGTTTLTANDNWGSAAASAGIAATAARVGAFPLADGSRDAAVVAEVAPGGYTALIAPAAGTAPGVGMVEVYDADTSPGRARLVNVATRGEVGAGDAALVAGFVLDGARPRRVLVRAVGPALAQFGLAGVLADPVLTIFRGAIPIAHNDDWPLARFPAAAAAAAEAAGAFALPPGGLDAALILTLEPGAYTAQVTGLNGTSGLCLVEVYDAN